MNRFDSVAPFYDVLARLVFRDALGQAQRHFLSKVREQDAVLIIGGGTGEILEHIVCREIDFLEKSSVMITRAKLRKSRSNVNFLQEDALVWKTEKSYDVIICPFVLDCFQLPSLEYILAFCRTVIRDNGTLIVTDFRKNGKNGWLLRLMYFFFKWVADLDASKLLPIHKIVLGAGFCCVEKQVFCRKSIFSALYFPD